MARGLLDSSVRYSLEGRAIASVVEELAPEAARLVEQLLQGAGTPSDLPSAEQLVRAVEAPIRAMVENEVTQLLETPQRRGFASSIHQGAIRAATAGVEPALATLGAQVATLSRNRQAQLAHAQAVIDSAKPKPKPETPFQRVMRLIGVLRTIWWVIAGIASVVLWSYSGFPLPI